MVMSGFRANHLSASLLNSRERLDELGSILALGLVRLRARQSSGTSASGAKSSVDFRATESVCQVHSNRGFPT